MADFFPKDSVVRRVNLEPAVLFGAGRALALQLADPVVAQGVQDHSEFKRNPFKRLQGTAEATYSVVFGSDALARGVGRRIHWIHEFVVGPTYQANDPEHLLWVHATLVDTALRCYTTYVDRLSPADEETYYQEMTRVAELFGVPRDTQPATIADFRAYVDATLGSFEVTPVGRELISFIVRPALPLGAHVPLSPLLRLQRLVTLGSTPPVIRDQLGLPWDEEHERRFEAAERRVRAIMRSTPRPLRTLPPQLWGQALLWQAGRHVRQFDQRHPEPVTDAA